MLRVVWIVPGFSSNKDDWCIPALLDLAQAVANRCHLKIVAMRYPYRRDRYPLAGATVYSIGGGHRGMRYTPGIWRDTAHVVRGIPCDLLHAFWAYEPGLVAAWFSPRLPVVVSLAGGESVSLPGIGYGQMRKWRTRIMIRWALERARAVTAGSPYLVDHARQTLRLPGIRHMPFGVDLRRWPFSSHEAAPPMILNAGSLEPVKGQSILLRALSQVLPEMPLVRCRIVGGGREREKLEKLANVLGLSGRVEFAGQVPHPGMAAVYGGAALFVQSSWHEAQGMAVIEAAACGLPLAGTAVGAMADFAPDAATGTPAGDERQLAAAVLQLLSHRDLAGESGRRARAKVEQTYGIETAADRFLELYQSLV